jgi:Fibronectin type III domain
MTSRGRTTRDHSTRWAALFAVCATILGLTWAAPAQAADSHELRVSGSADRSASHPLSGHKLTGAVFVFVTPTTNIKSVAFYVDDSKRRHKPRTVDKAKPFDLKGGTSTAATPWFTTALRDGKHTITAVLTPTTGHASVISSTFTTSNPTPRPKATTAQAGNGRVTLTWASGGGSTSGFNIYRSKSSKVSFKKPINAKPLAKTRSGFVDTKVKNGTTYFYVVRSLSARHKPSSGAKVSARPLVPPATPKAVAATSGDGQVKIKWSSGGGTVQGWRIYRGTRSSVALTTPIASLKPSARSWTDTGRANGTTFYYVVQAYANAFTATANAVPGTPIPAPDSLGAAPDDSKVTVSWHIGPGASAITGFRVYVGTKATVSISGTPAASTNSAAARSIVVTGLANNKKYFFRVVSVSATGKAPSVLAIAATPVAAPAAPTALKATATAGQIVLTWASTGKNTAGFNVYRGTSASVSTSGAPINDPLLGAAARTYTDLSVASSTTYFYVVVAVGTARNTLSNTASAKTPSVGTGPTASPWGNLQPTNLDWPAGPIRNALGEQLTDLRYVFNRIGTTNVDKDAVLHVKPWSDLTIRNTGGSPITISSLHVTGPYSIVFARAGAGTAGADVAFPHSLAAGDVIHVQVQFDYCRAGCDPLPLKGVQYGTLVATSNDPGHTTESVVLAGAWQQTSGGTDELPLVTFINQVLGIPTRLVGGTDAQGKYKGINYGNGLVAAVGDEVLSPYWNATGTVGVRQIIATHTQGGSEPLFWYPEGSPLSAHTFLSQAGTDWQTLLPGGSAGPRAEGTFSPSGTFGFRVNGGDTPTGDDWSDDTFNTTVNDVRHGCLGPCGHHIRFYPLKNASGAFVPNTYLMCVDSLGVNLDFNDEDYIVSGITPA